MFHCFRTGVRLPSSPPAIIKQLVAIKLFFKIKLVLLQCLEIVKSYDSYAFAARESYVNVNEKVYHLTLNLFTTLTAN